MVGGGRCRNGRGDRGGPCEVIGQGVTLIGIDTDVLVRFLTQDDLTQSSLAIKLQRDAGGHKPHSSSGDG